MDENTLPVELTVEEPTLENEADGVTQEPPKEEAFTREAAERFWQEREERLKAEFQAQLQETERRAQSIKDKARENVIKKQKQFNEETVPLLKQAGIEVTPDLLENVSKQIREQEFWDSTPVQQPKAPPKEVVTQDSIQSYLSKLGLQSNAIDVSKYVGQDPNDPVRSREFYAEVEAAAKAQRERIASEQAAKKQQEAKKVTQVKKDFGTTSGSSANGGAAPNVQNLHDELAQLLKQVTGDPLEKQKNRDRRNEIEAELRKLGQWGSSK